MTEVVNTIEVSIPLLGFVVIVPVLVFIGWMIGYKEGIIDKRKGVVSSLKN